MLWGRLRKQIRIDGRTDESRYRKTPDELKGKLTDAAIRRVDHIYDEAVQLADSHPGDVEAIRNFMDRVGDLFDAVRTRVRKLMTEFAENAAQWRQRLPQKIADEFVVIFNMINAFLGWAYRRASSVHACRGTVGRWRTLS